MSSDESFAEFLARLDSNDPQAGTEIFERYVEQLVRLATPRLVGAIRQKVDPEDVVQSAFGSFFRRNSRDAFKFESWDDLWAILATLTLRKCRFRVRQFLTVKRHVNREESLDAADSSSAGAAVCSDGPTSAEAAELADFVAQLLDRLDGKARPIAELALQGLNVREIAPRVGLTERSVFRQMGRIRAKARALAYGTEA